VEVVVLEDEECSEESVLDEELITFRLKVEATMSMGSMSRENRDALGGSPRVCLKSRM